MASDIPLDQQVINLRQSIFDEGLLEQHRFIQLEDLENEHNPNFIEEVFDLFFRDSTKYIGLMEGAMNRVPPDAFALERTLYRFKGCSANIGAGNIRKEVNQMRDYCNQGNFESAKVCLQQLKREQAALKAKFNSYLQLLKQAKAAEKDVPPK